jgi:anthranilate synthase component 2
MILIIDNYDSFVHNLSCYAQELGREVMVFRNDCITIDQIKELNPSHIIISPGPCEPEDAGISTDVVEHFSGLIPILGICLGHHCIGHVFGGEVAPARQPMHGKTSLISHQGTGVFRDLPDPLRVTRYHSLVVSKDNLPDCLKVTATSCDDEIMAFSHTELPIVGVQFHPEGVLTHYGHELLHNFLEGCYR